MKPKALLLYVGHCVTCLTVWAPLIEQVSLLCYGKVNAVQNNLVKDEYLMCGGEEKYEQQVQCNPLNKGFIIIILHFSCYLTQNIGTAVYYKILGHKRDIFYAFLIQYRQNSGLLNNIQYSGLMIGCLLHFLRQDVISHSQTTSYEIPCSKDPKLVTGKNISDFGENEPTSNDWQFGHDCMTYDRTTWHYLCCRFLAATLYFQLQLSIFSCKVRFPL